MANGGMMPPPAHMERKQIRLTNGRLEMNKSKTVAVQQIRRLRAKPFYPTADIENGEKSNPGEKELARTLYTYAQSDFHMEQVINAATIRRFGDNGQDRCPSTSDIWQLCGEINPAPATKAIVVNQNCEECAARDS
jgi:hypothetical protein